MKRKMARKQQEEKEESKETLTAIPLLDENKQKDMELSTNDSKDILLMRIVTWLRDSHALFDYESRQIHKKNLKIDSSCKFLRSKDEVKTISITAPYESEPDSKPLFKLIKDQEGSYFIENEKNTEKLWLVVRAMKTEARKISYNLKKSDIIKLGRIQFRVKDMMVCTCKADETIMN
jgi:hypothetical protein